MKVKKYECAKNGIFTPPLHVMNPVTQMKDTGVHDKYISKKKEQDRAS